MNIRTRLFVPSSRAVSGGLMALLFIALNTPWAFGENEPLKVTFDKNGLATLNYQGADMLTRQKVIMHSVQTTDQYRNPNDEIDPTTVGETASGNPYDDQRELQNADTTPNSQRFHVEAARLTQTYDWGKFTVKYKPNGNRLDITVTVHNTSDRVIEHMKYELLRFNPPGKKINSKQVPKAGWWARDQANIGAPTVIQSTFADGQAVLVAPRPEKPLRYQLRQVADQQLALQVIAGQLPGKKAREPYDAVFNVRPLKPGTKDTYTISLRFARTETHPLEIASDALAHYRENHPFTLDWPDRRPIGAMHIADYRTSEDNPRGWKAGIDLPEDWSIKDENAIERFREAALESARKQADQMVSAGFQGLVVWQPSGQEFRKPSYYGEPRLVEYIAPEMDAVIDDYFRVFREHGLRIGMTIRPVIHAPHDSDGNRVKWENIEKLYKTGWTRKGRDGMFAEGYDSPFARKEARSVLARLNAKISYAKKRWNASLFYVDANFFWRPRKQSGDNNTGWDGRLISARLFRKLARMHPDVLLIPEHQTLGYWSATAPYVQPPKYGKWTPDAVRRVYPGAFSTVRFPSRWKKVKSMDDTQDYIQAFRRGDIPLPHGWFKFDAMADLMRRFSRDVPYLVALGQNQIATLRGPGVDKAIEVNAGPKSLASALRERINADQPVRKRRVRIRFEQGTDPMRVRRIVDAIGKTDAIVVWSAPASRNENEAKE